MKDKTKVRTKIVIAYVTEHEYSEIVKAALKTDMSFSSFLRKAAVLLAEKELNN